DDVDQIARPVARERREAAEVHEDRPVAVEHDDLPLRTRQRDAEPYRRGQPHRVLQVEEVRAVADRLQLRRDRAHDRDDDAPFERRINRLQRIQPRHPFTRLTLPVRPTCPARISCPPTSSRGTAGARRVYWRSTRASAPSRFVSPRAPDDRGTRTESAA